MNCNICNIFTSLATRLPLGGGILYTYKSTYYSVLENYLGDKRSCRPNYFVHINSLNY